MDANHQHLPYDVVEIIIDFVSDTSLQTTDRKMSPERTLLVCALVCNTWLWPARHRLTSLYPRLGVVKLHATPQDFLKLHDIFTSPLCTLDPVFIQVLNIRVEAQFQDSKACVPFSTLLPILTEISLPSLHTINFWGILPCFDGSPAFAPESPESIPPLELGWLAFKDHSVPIACQEDSFLTRPTLLCRLSPVVR